MGSAVTTRGSVKVTVRGAEHAADRIATFLDANGLTAAQYNAGKAACVKRAKGESLTAPENTVADRFTAMVAAAFGDIFKVEAV